MRRAPTTVWRSLGRVGTRKHRSDSQWVLRLRRRQVPRLTATEQGKTVGDALVPGDVSQRRGQLLGHRELARPSAARAAQQARGIHQEMETQLALIAQALDVKALSLGNGAQSR